MTNPMNDFEVPHVANDSISSLAFSPATLPKSFLIAGSWDNQIRCWEVEESGKSVPKAMQACGGAVLDVCWSDDGTKVFMAGCDKQARVWDLTSGQVVQVAQHQAPIKTCHWIKAPNYSCLMTGSWDKTLKFWDTRTPNPVFNINLPERCYCADVDYPLAVVGTADQKIIVYQLQAKPQEFKVITSPLKYQVRCVAMFRNKENFPNGFAIGGVEGRVAIQYVNSANHTDNFIFKCHRSTGNDHQNIHVVNDIAVHPVHDTLATVGSDGAFSFWDKNARFRLNTSAFMEQPITRCAFNSNGQIFAYAVSYDWSKGDEFYDPTKKNHIFLRSCYDELKPRVSS